MVRKKMKQGVKSCGIDDVLVNDRTLSSFLNQSKEPWTFQMLSVPVYSDSNFFGENSILLYG